ncbi:MAG: hypothetical protein CM15mP79_2340 [Methanobacteriota archaeon]|nr:MAG: hypothetical protein CM15mP79_2340 [Euryarchaeota archaeon]
MASKKGLNGRAGPGGGKRNDGHLFKTFYQHRKIAAALVGVPVFAGPDTPATASRGLAGCPLSQPHLLARPSVVPRGPKQKSSARVCRCLACRPCRLWGNGFGRKRERASASELWPTRAPLFPRGGRGSRGALGAGPASWKDATAGNSVRALNLGKSSNVKRAPCWGTIGGPGWRPCLPCRLSTVGIKGPPRIGGMRVVRAAPEQPPNEEASAMRGGWSPQAAWGAPSPMFAVWAVRWWPLTEGVDLPEADVQEEGRSPFGVGRGRKPRTQKANSPRSSLDTGVR